MKKITLALLFASLFLVVSPVLAQSNIDGLTEVQAAELNATAAKLRAENALVADKVTIPVINATPEEFKEYVGVGAAIGKALSSTVWHLFGTMVIHVIAGIGLLAWLVPIWCWSFRKHAIKQPMNIKKYKNDAGKNVEEILYEDEYYKDKYSTLHSRRGEILAWHWVILAIIFIAATIVTFTW